MKTGSSVPPPALSMFAAIAKVEAAQHAKHDVHNWPGTPFFGHIDADPDTNRERASWLCPDCKQYCASHNPCDCCGDEEWP